MPIDLQILLIPHATQFQLETNDMIVISIYKAIDRVERTGLSQMLINSFNA